MHASLVTGRSPVRLGKGDAVRSTKHDLIVGIDCITITKSVIISDLVPDPVQQWLDAVACGKKRRAHVVSLKRYTS
jgi:hypothetical protein